MINVAILLFVMGALCLVWDAVHESDNYMTSKIVVLLGCFMFLAGAGVSIYDKKSNDRELYENIQAELDLLHSDRLIVVRSDIDKNLYDVFSDDATFLIEVEPVKALGLIPVNGTEISKVIKRD